MKSGPTIAEALRLARKERRALAAFNAVSFDAMLGISAAAASLRKPVIIQTSAGLVRKQGPARLGALFQLARSETGAETYLHLDHCDDLTLIAGCVANGWDMVMYDGSHRPVADNIEATLEVVRIAHAAGVAVEGEIGAIGGVEDGAAAGNGAADPATVANYAEATAVDCVAVGFGNVHGPYVDKTNLQWEILEDSGRDCPAPFVLHGGTGLSPAEFRRAVAAGCAKVNISTALKEAYVEALAGLSSEDVRKAPASVHEAIATHCGACAAAYIGFLADPTNNTLEFWGDDADVSGH